MGTKASKLRAQEKKEKKERKREEKRKQEEKAEEEPKKMMPILKSQPTREPQQPKLIPAEPGKSVSYDALKSIVKYSKVEAREQMSRIPAIQAMASAYSFDRVAFEYVEFIEQEQDLELKVGDYWRKWGIFEKKEPGTGVLYCEVKHEDSKGMDETTYVVGPAKIALERLSKKYLKDGMKTRVLRATGMEDTDLWANLVAEHVLVASRFKDSVDRWKIGFDGSRSKNCKEVSVGVPGRDALDTWVSELTNQRINLPGTILRNDRFAEILTKYTTTPLPHGSSFTSTVRCFPEIMEQLEWIVENCNGVFSKFPDVEDTFMQNRVTIPVNETTEVAIFPLFQQYVPMIESSWNIRVEVMKIGARSPFPDPIDQKHHEQQTEERIECENCREAKMKAYCDKYGLEYF